VQIQLNLVLFRHNISGKYKQNMSLGKRNAKTQFWGNPNVSPGIEPGYSHLSSQNNNIVQCVFGVLRPCGNFKEPLGPPHDPLRVSS
jgi:hypothetical protein